MNTRTSGSTKTNPSDVCLKEQYYRRVLRKSSIKLSHPSISAALTHDGSPPPKQINKQKQVMLIAMLENIVIDLFSRSSIKCEEQTGMDRTRAARQPSFMRNGDGLQYQQNGAVNY